MKTIQKSGLIYYQFENLATCDQVTHFVSTRIGGQSKTPFDSLNLGLKVNDEYDNVIKNRKTLAKAVSIDLLNFVIPSQCHSNNVLVVDEKFKGKGIFDRDDAIADTDSLVTNKPGICLLVFAADCVPVLLYDPIKKAIAVAHAGWKGTVNKIVRKTILTMIDNFNTDPSDIIAGIGPSIGPCCYKVGGDVINEVYKSFNNASALLIKDSFDNTYFDLWSANHTVLIESGICSYNINVSELCTNCNHGLFFSHRQGQGKTGRFGAGIMIK